MKPRNGLQKEDIMVATLNDKRVGDLNENLKNMLMKLYGVLDDNEIVKCRKMESFSKPDIIITYKGFSKYVSIKSGMAREVHEEQITTVISFLHRVGISKETIETLLLFQYGDGTTNGLGEKRMRWDDVYRTYEDRIEKANNELNKNKKILLDVMERCLFQGVDAKAPSADAIYHGDVISGVIVTKRQFQRYFLIKDWSHYNSFHIGPVVLRPHSRDVDKKIKNEHLRHRLQFNWPTLKADMLYINKYFSPYTRISVL